MSDSRPNDYCCTGWTPTPQPSAYKELWDKIYNLRRQALELRQQAADLEEEARAIYDASFTDESEPDYDAQAEWHLEQKFGEPVHS